MVTRLVMFLVVVFALPLVVLAQDEPVIQYEAVVSGEITEEIPEIHYTFEGDAGDVITARMSAVNDSGLDSFLKLLDVDGEEVLSNDDSAGNLNAFMGPYRLPVAGDYTVVATRCCGGSPGGTTGAFELLVSAEPFPMLTLDGSFTAEVNADNPTGLVAIDAGELASGAYVVTAVGSTENAPFSVDLRGPRGEYFNGAYWQMGSAVRIEPVIFHDGGIILASVLAQGTMETGEILLTSVTLNLDALEVQPYTLGEAIDVTLNSDQPSILYNFEANSADLMRLSGTGTVDSFPAEIQIFAPDSSSLAYADTSYPPDEPKFLADPMVLRETGTYYLLARRQFRDGMVDDSAESEFTFTVDYSDVVTLTNGESVTAAVDADNMYTATYRYEGVAGQSITVTFESLDDQFAPAVNFEYAGEIERNESPFVFGFNATQPGAGSFSFELPTDGMYLLRVNNGVYAPEGPQVGAFSLMVDLAE